METSFANAGQIPVSGCELGQPGRSAQSLEMDVFQHRAITFRLQISALQQLWGLKFFGPVQRRRC